MNQDDSKISSVANEGITFLQTTTSVTDLLNSTFRQITKQDIEMTKIGHTSSNTVEVSNICKEDAKNNQSVTEANPENAKMFLVTNEGIITPQTENLVTDSGGSTFGQINKLDTEIQTSQEHIKMFSAINESIVTSQTTIPATNFVDLTFGQITKSVTEITNVSDDSSPNTIQASSIGTEYVENDHTIVEKKQEDINMHSAVDENIISPKDTISINKFVDPSTLETAKPVTKMDNEITIDVGTSFCSTDSKDCQILVHLNQGNTDASLATHDERLSNVLMSTNVGNSSSNVQNTTDPKSSIKTDEMNLPNIIRMADIDTSLSNIIQNSILLTDVKNDLGLCKPSQEDIKTNLAPVANIILPKTTFLTNSSLASNMKVSVSSNVLKYASSNNQEVIVTPVPVSSLLNTNQSKLIKIYVKTGQQKDVPYNSLSIQDSLLLESEAAIRIPEKSKLQPLETNTPSSKSISNVGNLSLKDFQKRSIIKKNKNPKFIKQFSKTFAVPTNIQIPGISKIDTAKLNNYMLDYALCSKPHLKQPSKTESEAAIRISEKSKPQPIGTNTLSSKSVSNVENLPIKDFQEHSVIKKNKNPKFRKQSSKIVTVPMDIQIPGTSKTNTAKLNNYMLDNVLYSKTHLKQPSKTFKVPIDIQTPSTSKMDNNYHFSTEKYIPSSKLPVRDSCQIDTVPMNLKKTAKSKMYGNYKIGSSISYADNFKASPGTREDSLSESEEDTDPRYIPPFTCDTCNETFKKMRKYLEHQKFHVSYNYDKCLICGEVFETKTALKDHTLNHIGKVLFQCCICKEILFTEDKTMQHIYEKHPNHWIYCNYTLDDILDHQFE